MSIASRTPEPVKHAYRTVTPGVREQESVEMDVVGWLLFLGIAFLLLPLLPFVAIVWAAGKVSEAIAGREDVETVE
jgi:hypothetical protein